MSHDPFRGGHRPALEAVTVTLRGDLNGVEIRFLHKPPATIRARLLESGWRWHAEGRYWYHRATTSALEMAQSIREAYNLP